jgi:CpeS-like protein
MSRYMAIRLSEFPPSDLASFLRLCDGEWLTVRSRFQLEDAGADRANPEPPAGAAVVEAAGPAIQGPFGNDDPGQTATEPREQWHDSARGALLVAYLEPGEPHEPGSLQVTPPALDSRAGTPQHLHFQAGGGFERRDQAGNTLSQGTWQLWSDGSLELTQAGTNAVVHERIWFTKPNLRLRSSVECRSDGSPARASFSSEIRRVSRPAP